MEQKSYAQMRLEFVNFYQKKVLNKLPLYNKIRAEGSKKILAFFMTFVSFTLMIGCLILVSVFKLPKSIVLLITIFSVLFGIIAGISMLCLIRVTRNDESNVIKTDYEMDLKRGLMIPFVNIFFENAVWKKNSVNSSEGMIIETESYEKYKYGKVKRNFRELKILNPYPYMIYDDSISGQFRDVNINIFEGDTNPFSGFLWVVYLFMFVWLTAFSQGLFLYFMPVIIIVFSVKILQYSPFRGLLVEFDMNKNFQGHTVIYEKSLRAKKIPRGKSFQEVKLEASDFSNKYDVYSTDQIEARYLLTPSMMERIENLKFKFKAKYVRGSFKDNKLTLAIHTGKDMFAMGSDFKDSDSNTFQELFDEMISILKIVDELKLNQHIGL